MIRSKPHSRSLSIAALCAILSPPLAHSKTLTEDSCSVVLSEADGPPIMQELPELSVLNRRFDEPFTVPGSDHLKIHAIICWRSEARLAEHDDAPLEAGFSQIGRAHV